MRHVLSVVLVCLTSSIAYSEEPSVNSFCVNRVFAVRQAPQVTGPRELSGAAAAAVGRAEELTESKGISPKVVSTKFVGLGTHGNYGLHVRVADSSDPGQANAYEFVFEIAKGSSGTYSARLLTYSDDWHTHGDYETVFVCE